MENSHGDDRSQGLYIFVFTPFSTGERLSANIKYTRPAK